MIFRELRRGFSKEETPSAAFNEGFGFLFMTADPEYEHAKDVKQRYTDSLMSRERVVGVGVNRRKTQSPDQSQWVIVVYVSRKIPPHQIKPADLIPREIEGVKTDVVETGQPIPFDT